MSPDARPTRRLRAPFALTILFAVAAGAVMAKNGVVPLFVFGTSVAIMAAATLGAHFWVRSWTRRTRAELRTLFDRATQLVRQDSAALPASLADSAPEGLSQRLG